ncbi:MAG: hypothetical protein A2504_09915 [Bdellovibrionales bacterium RIFOXYD12_FULL_39_22]|nr:MAG: hypothetical protein A2385_17550 [Bdellovibrionales bacterium RIFOXYB1_FULL_39_21]OFZ43926.1 MAG: hypothetical protein A2485_04220 [Bdellovibrionales bacterium RIFOXYC12_FULL_39_17]OFZ48298.1 MAG: hypothetical protein A2404_01635 [Bdellovibrionales bacterium RIFOXYC1_FULL_39_130]OFZ94889.1 MAG: hypothetical protein A2504_09915 [Bdellovibrionales bacterium RIFOXYD12_FULL_39_22]HLE12690.1 hypothetical protein [Bacteriovoracaceae bacterium]
MDSKFSRQYLTGNLHIQRFKKAQFEKLILENIATPEILSKYYETLTEIDYLEQRLLDDHCVENI